ncbi:MAG: hypothetical protein MUO77_12325, partial [Anaerolineales bacterium]|nr:hypothetical protein [Anaerolineales bacterium]
MVKVKRNIKKAAVIENNSVVVEIKMTPASRYKMIPVDQQTHARLMALCSAYGFGQRGQGAMVRKLVNSEFERIPSAVSTP